MTMIARRAKLRRQLKNRQCGIKFIKRDSCCGVSFGQLIEDKFNEPYHIIISFKNTFFTTIHYHVHYHGYQYFDQRISKFISTQNIQDGFSNTIDIATRYDKTENEWLLPFTDEDKKIYYKNTWFGSQHSSYSNKF